MIKALRLSSTCLSRKYGNLPLHCNFSIPLWSSNFNVKKKYRVLQFKQCFNTGNNLINLSSLRIFLTDFKWAVGVSSTILPMLNWHYINEHFPCPVHPCGYIWLPSAHNKCARLPTTNWVNRERNVCKRIHRTLNVLMFIIELQKLQK